MKTFQFSVPLDAKVGQIGASLVFLKCLVFLERSDLFLAVFIPFIISALKRNLCLSGKISAEDVQFPIST